MILKDHHILNSSDHNQNTLNFLNIDFLCNFNNTKKKKKKKIRIIFFRETLNNFLILNFSYQITFS
jgi:hypothetical protein